jgi:hypothetical protein
MKLGNFVASVTKSFGFGPCETCEERRERLNAISRSAFIGGVFGLIAATKIGAFKLVTGDDSMPVESALGLMRTLSTVQTSFLMDNGRCATKEEMLKALLVHKAHTEMGSYAAVYMSRLNVDSEEIIPGWIMDFWSGAPEEFVLMLVQKEGEQRDALITDDDSVIYRAKVSGKHPSAQQLVQAKDFPGSKSIDNWDDNPGAYVRFKSRLKSVSYGVPPDLCTGCPSKGCVYCVQLCCQMRCYNIYPPPRPFFTCGAANCRYGITGGGGQGCTLCNACAHMFSTCCLC